MGITSHLNVCIALAGKLEAAGHQVILASPRAAAGVRVAAEGLSFHALGGEGRVPPQTRKGKAGARQRRRARYDMSLQGFAIDGLLEDWRPDQLLVDSEFHAVILHLLGHGLSPLILEYHVAPRRRPGLPPPNASRLPGDGASDRLRSALEWRALLLRRRLRLWWGALRSGWHDEPSAWRRIARRACLPWGRTVRTDHWPLLTYPQLPHLYLNAGALQFPGHQEDPAYVGPMVQRTRADTTQAHALAAVRDYLAQRDRSRPLVACLVGSILSLPAFLRRVRDAAEGADFDLLIAHGTRLPADELQPLPANVYAAPYVPQLDVLDHADALICHGGIGTLNEAVLAQVPMLVCSAGNMDEHGNAARVVYHGLGLRLDLRRATPAALRAATERLLRESSYREAVERMAAHYRECERQQLAVRRVETFLPANPESQLERSST